MSLIIPKARVVIVAQNAATNFGGEAILPVHYFRILRARGADVHLIAHARNRADLIDHLQGDMRNIDFVENTRTHKLLTQVEMRASVEAISLLAANVLNLWNEILQRRRVIELAAQVPVTVIHLPTPVSPRAVSIMCGLGSPTVYGPMNGGMTYPPGYTTHRSRLQQAGVSIGRGAARIANLLFPGKALAARLLVANDRTGAALPVRGTNRVSTLVENGVQLDVWQTPLALAREERADGPFRLAFVGRLVAFKAVDITLRALASARERGLDVRLDIVGGGEEEPRLRALVRELGLEGMVTFHGFLPQTEAAAVLARGDALVLNSLNDCGGAVVLEGMAMGLPVIASAWGGPLDYLDASCGILVHPFPHETFATRLADAIETLARDPVRAREMGRAGRARVVAEFDWEKKVDRIVEIFDEVAASTAAAADGPAAA